MPKQQYSLSLEPEVIRKIDDKAKKDVRSRSFVMNEILTNYFKEGKK